MKDPERYTVLTGAGPRPRCRCANDDAGRCPNAVDDPAEAPYCPDCHTLRVYDMNPEECTHDAHDL